MDLKKIMLQNLANVCLKVKNPKECISVCNKVLEIDPNSVKAYFFRSQGNLGILEHDNAINDIK